MRTDKKETVHLALTPHKILINFKREKNVIFKNITPS